MGVLLAMLLGSSSSRGLAEGPPLPSPLPEGYTIEPAEAVRWVYPSAGEAEVSRLKRTLQEAWPRLLTELGAPPQNEEGESLDLRIGVNPEQMQALVPDLRLPPYASGVALPKHGLILLTFTAPGSWLRPDMERVLVHELSHVALHRALGGRPVPRWFSEGLAVHQAGEHSLQRIRTLWEGTLGGRLIPLSQLSRSFPPRHGEVSLAYAQSADLVRYLLSQTDGKGRLRRTLDAVRAGQPFEEALAEAYAMPLAELEREWQSALRSRFGRWPSVLMGLTLVWAFGALLLVVGYVRARRRHRRTLRRWAIEEAPIAAQAAASAQAPAAPSSPPAPAAPEETELRPDSGVPTVVHEGQSHTLH